jgi:Zn-dependent M28 family amino/carboxypeptidase
VNPGAAYIEDQFVDYFESVGIDTDPTAFDGRSDYKPFQDNGIAAGGLFSGAEVAKTAEQAAKWGGQAGVAFDPCYHQACDDIDNIDAVGFEQLSDGGAHVTAALATDPALRDSLAGGATATAAKAKKLSKAKKAKLGAYRGKKLQR